MRRSFLTGFPSYLRRHLSRVRSDELRGEFGREMFMICSSACEFQAPADACQIKKKRFVGKRVLCQGSTSGLSRTAYGKSIEKSRSW